MALPSGAGVILVPGTGKPTSPTGVSRNGFTIQFAPSSTGQAIEIFDNKGAPIWSVPPAGGPACYGDKVRAGPAVLGNNFLSLDGTTNPPSLSTQTNGNRVWFGSGLPTAAILSGTVTTGDYYFRQDTPGVANQHIYVCTAGNATPAQATWTALL